MEKYPIKKIVFIITDTLRAKSVGLYGQFPSPTKNIDKLGTSSVVFTNTFCSSTCTDPSISSIMTGKYPLTLGIINHGRNVTAPEEKNLEKTPFLSEILKRHGFKTAAVDWIGRWHKRGYDYYSGALGKDFDSYPIIGKLPFPFVFRILDKISAKLLKRTLLARFYYALSPHPKIPYDTADLVVAKAIDIINKNKSKPFLLYLHFWDAHAPHVRPTGLKSYLTDNVENTYNAEIRFLDKEIGRLIDYLDKTHQLDETLIILTADHGENLSEHDIIFNHENLYEDVVKVPLLFRHKSLVPKKINAFVQHIDIIPTILEMLGIANPPSDGKSLLPLISGKAKSIRDFVYFEDITYRKLKIMKDTRRRGIRLGQYKYIETLTGKKKDLYEIMPRADLKIQRQEVYDLNRDPLEKNNLAKSRPRLVQALDSKLNEHILSLNLSRLHRLNPILEKKIKKSINIIRKTLKEYRPEDVAIAFKGGKDTMAMLHIIRSIYKGKIPFKLMFNDTTMEFPETYEFIEKMEKLWNLDLKVVKHSAKELQKFHALKDPAAKNELARLMKITAIENALKKYKFKAFMAAIRRDEHPARAKEKYFARRKNHLRIHPMLHFTEKDIWDYIHLFGVPYSTLYDQGYRSVGEKLYTEKSQGKERSGREAEKEKVMAKLRKMGYW